MPDSLDTGMDTGAPQGSATGGIGAGVSEPAGGGAAHGSPAGGQPPATRPDYLLEGYNSAEDQARAFHQQHGSIQEMQQLAQWYQENYNDLQQWHQSRQQGQQQQPQGPKSLGWLEQSKDPQFLAAFQMAQMNGGQLPENYQNREQAMQQLSQVQQFWDNAYTNPEQMMLDLLQLPGVQQVIQQMSGQVVQPVQQQVHQQHVQTLLQTYGPQLQKMDPMVQELFNAGRFGTGEQAAKDALAYNQKLMGRLTPQQPAQPQQAKPAQPSNAPTNGKPTNGAPQGQKDRRAASEAAIKESSRAAAKARIAMMKDGN
jgi:hypothetical protein